MTNQLEFATKFDRQLCNVPLEWTLMTKWQLFSKLCFPVVLLVAFMSGCSGNDNGASRSSAKAITAYSLNGATGTINESANTISVTMPYGTPLNALVATFTTTAAGVQVGSVAQTSGTTANDFTNPVEITATAGDSTTAKYTVTVTVAAVDANAITSFSINGATGVINEAANPKTLTVTVPSATNLTNLIATFTTTGATVKVGSTVQVSGITPNDFTGPVTYTVTDSNNVISTYVVTVTKAASTAKSITAFSINGIAGTVNEAATPKTITVIVPNSTDVSKMVATFTSTGVSQKVGTVPQTSGVTVNNFTSPVTYVVTAGDATTANYIVTVTKAPLTAKDIIAFSINGIAGIIVETTTPKTITVTVPSGTNLTALAAAYTTTGTAVSIGAVTQASGETKNNFSGPLVYTVTAGDSSTANYNVTVSTAAAKGPATVNLGAAGNYVILATSGVSTVPASAITGDIGISPAATSFLTGFSLTMVGTTSATSTQVTGSLFGADMTTPTSSNLTTAVTNMGTAYTDAAGRPTPDVLNLGTGEIGGQIIVPGLYKWTTGVTASADVTLSGGANDVWIFQIPGNLAVNPAKKFVLSGGAQAKNIFWQVAGTVNIGTTAHFEGIILSQTSITLETGSSMNGRALAQTAVILQTATVTKPN